jgi:hypothetical protein
MSNRPGCWIIATPGRPIFLKAKLLLLSPPIDLNGLNRHQPTDAEIIVV